MLIAVMKDTVGAKRLTRRKISSCWSRTARLWRRNRSSSCASAPNVLVTRIPSHPPTSPAPSRRTARGCARRRGAPSARTSWWPATAAASAPGRRPSARRRCCGWPPAGSRAGRAPPYERSRAVRRHGAGDVKRASASPRHFGAEAQEVETGAPPATAPCATSRRREYFRRVSRFAPTVYFITGISIAILLGYGGALVARDAMTLGQLVVFAGLLAAVRDANHRHGDNREHAGAERGPPCAVSSRCWTLQIARRRRPRRWHRPRRGPLRGRQLRSRRRSGSRERRLRRRAGTLRGVRGPDRRPREPRCWRWCHASADPRGWGVLVNSCYPRRKRRFVGVVFQERPTFWQEDGRGEHRVRQSRGGP